MKQLLLALCLVFILGLPACTAESRVSAIRAKAEQGDVHAQGILGELYANGTDVKKDYGQAASWWSKSARGGLAQAQYNLGVLYEHGQGVRQSDADAALWYAKAADQGLAAAQYNLAVFYQQGRGVRQDAGAAAAWYRKAAEQGHTDAQYNLGALYARQNPAEAYFWLGVLAKSGDHDAQRLRDRIGAQLPAARAAEIERRVHDWRPVVVLG